MKPCFRFGQPVGTALVIVALVETIYSLYWLIFDFVSLEHTSSFNFFNGTADFEFFGHLQWHFWLALHFLISCIFWIAVVFEGRKLYLYAWLIVSLLHNAIFVAIIISQTIMRPDPDNQVDNELHPMLVGISLVFFCLWRLYTISVGCQGLKRLNNKYNTRSDSVSDLDICLEPLGSGPCQTWDFFKELPGVGAVTALTVELLWNSVNLIIRPLVVQMFGLSVLQVPIYLIQGITDFLILEETIVRCARMFLDSIGIYVLSKEKLKSVRIWVVFYFLFYIFSNTVNGLMITNWFVEEFPTQNIMIYHVIMLLSDNLFRLTVIYLTVKYGMVHVRTISKL